MNKWNLVRNNKRTIIERAKAQNNGRAKTLNNDRASTCYNNKPPQSNNIGQYQKVAISTYTPGKQQWHHVPPQNFKDGRNIGHPYQQYPKSTVPHDDRYQSSWHKEQEDFLNSLKWLDKANEDRDTTTNLEYKEGGFLKQYHDSPQSVGSTNNDNKINIDNMKTHKNQQKQNNENNSTIATNTAGLLDMPKWECNTDPSKNASRKGLGSQFQDGYQTDTTKPQLANKSSPTDKKDNENNDKYNVEKYKPRNIEA